ncbi:MAG: hypothetical protein B7X08_06460, partial [Acidocella sp. 20-63-7]
MRWAILLDAALARADTTTQASRIIDEILTGGPAPEVLLSPNTRAVAVALERGIATSASRQLPPGAVLVVSGGGRGVTAQCLFALAAQGPLRFALLGRTRLLPLLPGLSIDASENSVRAALLEAAKAAGQKPALRDINRQTRALIASAKIEQTLARLRALGCEARYIACDVEDAAAAEDALATIRAEWGAVHGLIHGAGVLADKRIADKTDAQVDAVFGPKVRG